MEKKGNKIYNYIHLKLIEGCNGDKCLSYEDLSFNLTYIRIPKMLVPKLIKELEDNGIINKINQRKFQINEYPTQKKKIIN